MGVFRTFVSAIALMMTMFFLWTQTNTLSPYLMELKDTSIQMGYPIILDNLERLILSSDEGNSTLEDEEDGEEQTVVRSQRLSRTDALEAQNNATDESKLPITVLPDKPNKASETLQQTSSGTEDSSCFSFDDSKEFWNTTRLSNINHDRRLIDANYLHKALQDPWSAQIVNETICHENSRFLDSMPGHLTDQDWQVRLLYLGLYLHQHLPAMKDIQTRQSCQADGNIMSPFNISSSGDYQCDPQTKYLVVSLPAKGAGATFRAGAVPGLLAGLAMDRVVIFVNDVPFGNIQMRSLWHLASKKHCPRGDIQCYFLPITPCVLTEEEVRNATVYGEAPAIKVLADGRPGKELSEYRVLVVTGKSSPLALIDYAERKMRSRAYDLVKGLAEKYGAPKHVLEQMLIPHQQQPYDNITDGTGNYNRGRSGLHHAAQLYLMRPHLEFRQEINAALQKAIPKDFNPEWSFGIPIRASDKCVQESTCLTFDQYMQLALQTYNKYSNGSNKHASIVLTSEAASMMSSRHNFTTSSEFPFQFVVNEDDVTQGSGRPRHYRSKSADKVMLSTMTALMLQLMPKYIVANCCSSFHQVMVDLIRIGCGAAKVPQYECLQETEDPQFHVCCQWNRDERCGKMFEDFHRKFENRSKEFA